MDFIWQYAEGGGRLQPGGSVVDFIVYRPELTMAWRVQGYYWHYVSNSEVVALDFRARQVLEALGYLVIDILDADLETPQERDWVLGAAMEGIELLELSPTISPWRRSFRGVAP